MCRMASGFINPRTMEIKVWDLTSHSETLSHLSLSDRPERDQWREMHYLPDGSVEARVLALDTHTASECEADIKARFPTFMEFLNWAISQRTDEHGCYSDSLYLNSLTNAEGLKLPKSIGEWLDLRSLTNAEGLKLPESIGGSLDLRSLTNAEGLKLPKSIGEWLDLRSLANADGLKLPESIGDGIYLNSLINTDGFKLPKSIGGYVYYVPKN